jgi:5-methylcytosine-specific restriction endonuclease McrA
MNGTCEHCGLTGKVHIHHRDFNHSNDVPCNHQTLCPHCHTQIHIPNNLARNQARRDANPVNSIDMSVPGWSIGMSWQELLDARQCNAR